MRDSPTPGADPEVLAEATLKGKGTLQVTVSGGEPNQALTVNVVNHGTTTVHLSHVIVDPLDLVEFSQTSLDDRCDVFDTLAPGGGCQVKLLFTPPTAGSWSGTLTFLSDSTTPTGEDVVVATVYVSGTPDGRLRGSVVREIVLQSR